MIKQDQLNERVLNSTNCFEYSWGRRFKNRVWGQYWCQIVLEKNASA